METLLDQLSICFSFRFLAPKELHKMTSVGRGTSVYCSASYYLDRKKNKEKVKFEWETKRVVFHWLFNVLISADKSTYFCAENILMSFIQTNILWLISGIQNHPIDQNKGQNKNYQCIWNYSILQILNLLHSSDVCQRFHTHFLRILYYKKYWMA